MIRELAEIRKRQLLEISIEIAITIGYKKITRELIAERAKISVSLITYHFKTMNYLKKSVLNAALKRNIKPIIAQAILQHDPRVKKLPRETKRKILEDVAHAI